MSRISIEVTEEEHRRLKALAALQGVSVKDYLLRKALPQGGEQWDLAQLEKFLAERVRRARTGKISQRTVGEIFDQAYRESDDPASS
jgi:hypothetical protein